ncbi:MAG: hypothetical protein ACRCZF_17405, partial [Gemmataceae bacterium]
HIGPKFDDPEPVSDAFLSQSAVADAELLAALAEANLPRFVNTIQAEQDARRICGFPPLWLTLQTIRATAGRVLHYQQFVHPRRTESVSFAAMAFDRAA